MLHEANRANHDFSGSVKNRQGWNGFGKVALLPKSIQQPVQTIVFQNVHQRLVNALGRIPLQVPESDL